MHGTFWECDRCCATCCQFMVPMWLIDISLHPPTLYHIPNRFHALDLLTWLCHVPCYLHGTTLVSFALCWSHLCHPKDTTQDSIFTTHQLQWPSNRFHYRGNTISMYLYPFWMNSFHQDLTTHYLKILQETYPHSPVSSLRQPSQPFFYAVCSTLTHRARDCLCKPTVISNESHQGAFQKGTFPNRH